VNLFIYITALVFLVECQNPVSVNKSNLDTCFVHENSTKDSANVTIKIGTHQRIIVQQMLQNKATTKNWNTYVSTKDSTFVFCNNNTIYVSWADIGNPVKCVNFSTGKDTVLTK
jgi:hypothetical protein